jgi:hypothetical protein
VPFHDGFKLTHYSAWNESGVVDQFEQNFHSGAKAPDDSSAFTAPFGKLRAG